MPFTVIYSSFDLSITGVGWEGGPVFLIKNKPELPHGTCPCFCSSLGLRLLVEQVPEGRNQYMSTAGENLTAVTC